MMMINDDNDDDDEWLSTNRNPNMTQNEHVYAIFCRPEVAGDGRHFQRKCKDYRGLGLVKF